MQNVILKRKLKRKIVEQSKILKGENVTIVIEGYLVQAKLEQVIKEIVGPQQWLGREQRLPVGRTRWDMTYKAGDQVTAVEFDGHSHYCDSLRIKADEEKDRIAREHGYKVVRIPYWVQLTTETLAHYFNLIATIKQDFPHGFIATKIFPASYCKLGILRFERELSSLPASVQAAVVRSLHDRAKEHGEKYVYP